MNHLRFLLAAAAVMLALPLHAATDSARELEQLTLERDQAVAAATNRYHTALDGLLRRATAANDFDTVMRIQQALGKPSPKTIAPLPGAKDEFLGSWKFFNHTDKHTALVELNGDKTYSAGGKRIGSWEVVDKQLIITYDDLKSSQDRYNLPMRDNKLAGKNKLGHTLMLSRVN